MWETLIDLLFSWWWWGEGGRDKTANAAWDYLMPVLMVLLVATLIVLLAWVALK